MKNIVVFGDSLSAPKHAWCRVIDQENYAHMMILARGGLKLTEFHYPDWVTNTTPAKFEPDAVCLYLGTNDALKRVEHREIETHLVMVCLEMLRSQLEVTVVLPPNYPRFRDRMAPVRAIFKDVLKDFPEFKAVSMPFGDYTQMEDQFHPNDSLHWCQAISMMDRWGLERGEQAA